MEQKKPKDYVVGDKVDRNLVHWITTVSIKKACTKNLKKSKYRIKRLEKDNGSLRNDRNNLIEKLQKKEGRIVELTSENYELKKEVDMLNRKMEYLHDFYKNIIYEEKEWKKAQGFQESQSRFQ
jgi:predicted RNase H-like nuclease (RuvC/YqgF family)